MRQSLGTAVFAGMLGVTAFGLLFTPAFYTVVRKFGRKPTARAIDHGHPHPVERTQPAE
jgi:hypothetical protein